MPTVVANNIWSGTIPGVARNIPIIAVKTISEVTLGLHNEKKLLRLKPMLLLVVVAAILINLSHF
jgi:hypothetical protein